MLFIVQGNVNRDRQHHFPSMQRDDGFFKRGMRGEPKAIIDPLKDLPPTLVCRPLPWVRAFVFSPSTTWEQQEARAAAGAGVRPRIRSRQVGEGKRGPFSRIGNGQGKVGDGYHSRANR